jgi:N-acetylglucosamine-6-phosphate deacetylase
MIYTGLSPATGRPIDVHVESGRIMAVSPSSALGTKLWIAPGFIDLQVNGYAGVDYNSPDAPIDEIARSIDTQRSCGVTRLFPTVITGSKENICGSLRNLAKAKSRLREGVSLEAFHVEGPWISADDGPRGAHPKEHVRPAAIEEWRRFQDAAEGQIRLLTVAPEQQGVLPLIEQVCAEGVVVSIGHTNATTSQIEDAIHAGATMSTHLGNGSHKEIPRFPNYIWDQLAADELYASLIVDGIHLPQAFVKVALRAKGLDRTILVTDAVAPAGCAPGIYRLGHLEVELLPENRVQLTTTGRLAGSALRMDRAVETFLRFTGLSLPEALMTATVNPGRALRIEGRQGFLEAGERADLILFRFDPGTKAIQIEQIVVAEASNAATALKQRM